MDTGRGSERLLAAWKSRELTEEAISEIANGFDESPAVVESVRIHGGASASGVSATVSYDGDDIPYCGNDIRFWLHWHLRHGGAPRPPRIIIKGTPVPEQVRLDLDFGWTTDGRPPAGVEVGPLGS